MVSSILLSTSCGEADTDLVKTKDSAQKKDIPIEEPKKEVKIGDQVWMAENLNVEKFQNGDLIPEAKSDEEWENAAKEKKAVWCYYNNNPQNAKLYGKMYNWYAVHDPRGLAPKGWKVPTNQDWNTLIAYLGGESIAGKKMKSDNNWVDDINKKGNGTNESGFGGTPGGGRRKNGSFNSLGTAGVWWTFKKKGSAWVRSLSINNDKVDSHSDGKGGGLSVRCIKD